MCVWHVCTKTVLVIKKTYAFVLSKEGIVRFCELKILKLGPSCVYILCSSLRRIRTQYFAGKSNFAYYGNTWECLHCMTVDYMC